MGSWRTRWRVDHFGIGAHNTDYFPLSAGDVVLAAIAWRTSRVHLGSTVTVISSDDPMRVFEPYATLGAVSNGRVRMPDGCAMRLTDGYEAAARVLARALDLLLDVKPEDDVGRWRNSPVPASDTIALDLWDAESWHTLRRSSGSVRSCDGCAQPFAVRAQHSGLVPPCLGANSPLPLC